MIILISSLILFIQVTTNPVTEDPVYTSEKSEVIFFSEAPLEDIEAISSKLKAALNTETGKLLFIIPMNSFAFEKQLMQKHFNEQYLETDKYPEARFDGQFINFPQKFRGPTEVPFEGILTIHGESRKITGKAKLESRGNIIYGKSTINIKLEDYKIKVPRMVIKNIAEVVEVKIKVELTPNSKH